MTQTVNDQPGQANVNGLIVTQLNPMTNWQWTDPIDWPGPGQLKLLMKPVWAIDPVVDGRWQWTQLTDNGDGQTQLLIIIDEVTDWPSDYWLTQTRTDVDPVEFVIVIIIEWPIVDC